VRTKSEARFVLDASAVLAYLQGETGHQRVGSALAGGAVISAVNSAEVYAKVIERGLPVGEIAARLRALGLETISFDEDDARQSAELYPKGRALGLALADRACLALGRRLSLPVLTADQVWKRMPGIKVELIR
jgi:ribonuclease VapC